MNTKHTPAPLHLGRRLVIYGPKGEAVADCNHTTNFHDENLANAAMIVRAVNAHDSLVAALWQCRAAIQGYKDTNKLHPDSVLAEALDNAKAALAQAEEQRE